MEGELEKSLRCIVDLAASWPFTHMNTSQFGVTFTADDGKYSARAANIFVDELAGCRSCAIGIGGSIQEAIASLRVDVERVLRDRMQREVARMNERSEYVSKAAADQKRFAAMFVG